jgi:hypothetical protein
VAIEIHQLDIVGDQPAAQPAGDRSRDGAGGAGQPAGPPAPDQGAALRSWYRRAQSRADRLVAD